MNLPFTDLISPATPLDIRVSYSEVDRMDVVYYGNYLRWFEMGRAEYLRSRGKTYRKIEEDGYLLPVIEAYVRYRQSAHYDDLVVVWTIPQTITQAKVTFAYKVERKNDGLLLAEGHTIHACRGPRGKIVRFPQQILDLLMQPYRQLGCFP